LIDSYKYDLTEGILAKSGFVIDLTMFGTDSDGKVLHKAASSGRSKRQIRRIRNIVIPPHPSVPTANYFRVGST
jgi:hypothetical protein